MAKFRIYSICQKGLARLQSVSVVYKHSRIHIWLPPPSYVPTSCLIKIYESQVDKMKFNSICGNFKRKPSRDIIGDWATRRRDGLQFVLAQQTESPGNLVIRG